MPIPLDLGEPDQSFHNLWKEEGDELWEEEDDRWGDDESDLSLRHPGFNKWTVHNAAGSGMISPPMDNSFYCIEAHVHFTGELIDGTQFVSGRENGIPERFILGQEDVMHGFNLAVSSMQPGEKAIFTIPPQLAVTKAGSPASIPSNIPPNQTLRFEIELIALFTISDICKDQGILKKIVKNAVPEREQSPSSDFVFVKYNACLMDGTSLNKSEGVEFSLEDGFFCPAFAHAVKTMKEGEEAILIVKPEYAFGEQGRLSQGDEVAVPPADATLYVHLQFVCWVYRIGEDRAIAKKILSIGNSQKIRAQSQAMVKVRLVGKLEDGTVFDRRGHDDDEPFEFVVDEGQVIDGLDEAVMTMEEGEVAEFTIPSQHAFGTDGSDQHQLAVVPPNSTVIYKIELQSVLNEKHPLDILSRAEVIEYATRKENEGDNYFNLGKYLRAHRRYYKARQIIEYSRFGQRSRSWSPIQLLHDIPTSEIDAQMEEMLVSFVLKAAKCAIQLRCYEQARNYYHEALEYDAENVEAQQQQRMVQEFPEGSSRVYTDTMHRGFEQLPAQYKSLLMELEGPIIPAAYSPRRKRRHSYRGGVFYVPHVAASPEQANSSRAASTPSSPAPATTVVAAAGTSGMASGNAAQSSGTVRTDRGFLFRCFGPSPTN